MYCPKCATLNNDQARFCRSCGMELEGVALALKDRAAQPIHVRGRESEFEISEEVLEKRSKAVKGVSTGISLLVVSILIAVAMAFFVPPNIPWILAWAVLVGWMAMWGGIEVGNGIAGVLEAKSRLRLLGLAGKEFADHATPKELPFASQQPMVPAPPASLRSSTASSVTEGTTRQLNDLVDKGRVK